MQVLIAANASKEKTQVKKKEGFFVNYLFKNEFKTINLRTSGNYFCFLIEMILDRPILES